jgi:hypothetical protein
MFEKTKNLRNQGISLAGNEIFLNGHGKKFCLDSKSIIQNGLPGQARQ